MKKQSNGSIYRVNTRQLGQIKFYAQLDCLSKTESSFLLGLLELCSSLENNFDKEKTSIDVTRDQLQEWIRSKPIGSGTTIIKKRSAALCQIGLFKKELIKLGNARPSHLYVLQDATDFFNVSTIQKKFSDHRPHRQKLKEIKAQLINTDAQILDNALPIRLARSERLWNGVFGSCMRTSRRDPRRLKPFETVYRIGDDQLKIITSSQSDSEICHVDDQRTIRAIITMACIEIEDRVILGKEVKNEFYIDIVDLCKIMGLAGSGANRDTVRDSMKRLYSTNFNLIIDSSSDNGHLFAERFGISPQLDDLNFRFLTELDSSIDRENGGGAIRRPRWYRIALHSKTYQDLTDPNVISTYIDNKEILKVSSGLIHLFYTWCSIHVKRSGNRVKHISLPDLQKFMTPAARYDNFRDRFILALKNYQINSKKTWQEGGINMVNLLGYKIKIEPDVTNDFVFTASRDKQDPIIGDRSTHNRLLKSSKHQAELDLKPKTEPSTEESLV